MISFSIWPSKQDTKLSFQNLIWMFLQHQIDKKSLFFSTWNIFQNKTVSLMIFQYKRFLYYIFFLLNIQFKGATCKSYFNSFVITLVGEKNKESPTLEYKSLKKWKIDSWIANIFITFVKIFFSSQILKKKFSYTPSIM